MPKEDWLKARLRARDWDIKAELEHRKLSYGEMADIVRDGVRRVLFDSKIDQRKIERIASDLIEEAK